MKTFHRPSLLASALVFAALSGAAAFAADAQDKPKAKPPIGEAYPLAACPISGEKLGSMGKPVVKDYAGREVRFCCGNCPPEFEKDLEKSLAKVDAAIVKDQLPLYPLDTSVVTGDKLGDKAVDWVYRNRLVRLANAGEQAEFLKEPAKYVAALDKAAVKAQMKGYPLATCPASGEKLDGGEMEAKDIVVGGRLIRLCCAGCVKDVVKDPARFIAKVEDARKAGKAADAKPDTGHDHGDK